MRGFIALIILIWALNGFAETNAYSGEYDLVEVRFNNVSLVSRDVHCNESEVEEGLWDLIHFGGEPTPGRKLIPSQHPLKREAAWYINQEDCPSLAPYFNGVGFNSFDSATGEAQIYLGGFNVLNMDSNKYERASNIDRARMFLQPDFELINVQLFSAQCTFLLTEIITKVEKIWRWLPYPHWENQTKRGDQILYCELSDDSGFVTLKRR